MERRISHVHQILAQPMLFMGVEYPLAMSNFLLALLFGAALHFWYWLGVTVLLHKLLQVVTKKDPLMRHIFLTYSHHADVYEPWPSTRNARGLRPRNIGRGDLW